MTYVEAAEGIRATIAAYAQALDDGRTDDIIALWCSDGVFEITGMGTYEGHAALRDFFTGVAPTRPQRHMIGNTLVTESTEREATATSDVVVFHQDDAVWAVATVGRYQDTLRRQDGRWLFQRRVLRLAV
jgi:3-phenylpropionate/cinnamic acid dioxygenase small subunit